MPWRTTRRCARSSRQPSDRAGAARLHRKIGLLHWEAGDRERARACFDVGPCDAWAGRRSGRTRAAALRRSGRLAFRAGDNANAIAWAERALAELAPGELARERAADGERAHETAATKRAGLQHAGRRAGAHGPAHRGGGADRAEHRAGRAARPAAGGLPRLHQPWRAAQLARPAAQHRDLPARAGGRTPGGRPCLPVAAAMPTSQWPTAR